MRKIHRREDYIPQGATIVQDELSSAIVVEYEKGGLPHLIGFHGRAQKPDFHYRYRTVAERQETARRHFNRWRDNEDYARREREKPMQLGVGDVLKASWGYEQTNVDYYEVTRVVGKASVEIRQIAAEHVEWGDMRGKSVPVPGQFVGEPMVKRVSGDSVKIASYAHAFKKERDSDGQFRPDSWTAYA